MKPDRFVPSSESHTNPAAQLIIAGFTLGSRAGHHLNELLGHNQAASALGMTASILVPRDTDEDLVSLVGANPVLDAVPKVVPFRPDGAEYRLISYAQGHQSLTTLWSAVENLNPRCHDLLFFPEANPILIRAAGIWLASRPPDQRPAIFFRFLGPELLRLDPRQRASTSPFSNLAGSELAEPDPARTSDRAIYYFLACEQLHDLPGQERIFFLAENAAIIRAINRVCRRRACLMPMPMKLSGEVAVRSPRVEDGHLVYLHVNHQSKTIRPFVSDIIRVTLAANPTTRFLVKFANLIGPERDIDTDLASFVDIVPSSQDPDDYLANFDRATIVVLPYDAPFYRISTSGVFAEAVAFGKLLVVPSGTWMADKMAEGVGVGSTFEKPTSGSIAGALLNIMRSADRLAPEALRRATNAREEHSCKRYLEKMVSLSGAPQSLTPGLQLGDEIDFSDPLDSWQFMGQGWGATGPSGRWTVGTSAELAFNFDKPIQKDLVLYALVQPYLAATHRRMTVLAHTAERQLAEWVFDLDDTRGIGPRWCEAPIPADAGIAGVFSVILHINHPVSPLALGMSDDPRPLGICIRKLIVEGGDDAEQDQTEPQ